MTPDSDRNSKPLIDGLGRVHTDLRISVTDRCNLRCCYCMPAEGVEFRSHANVLKFEEIERFVRVAAGLGIRKVRLTGGEPLVRKGVVALVEMLAAVPGIEDLAMTTNGILLDEFAEPLKAAGLHRLNISLDSVDRAKFEKITRRDELQRALDGIAAARRAGFEGTKLNALAIRGQCEEDIVPLAVFARDNDLELRFIEFMPVDGDRLWHGEQVLRGEEIVEILSAELGPITPVDSTNGSAASRFAYAGGGRLGVIPSVSEPFCNRCNRLRLTSEGMVRSCLFASDQWNARTPLRNDCSDAELQDLIRAAVAGKQKARGTASGDFGRSDDTMHQIGG